MHPWSPGLNLEFIYSVNVLYLIQESRKGLELLHWRAWLRSYSLELRNNCRSVGQGISPMQRAGW